MKRKRQGDPPALSAFAARKLAAEEAQRHAEQDLIEVVDEQQPVSSDVQDSHDSASVSGTDDDDDIDDVEGMNDNQFESLGSARHTTRKDRIAEAEASSPFTANIQKEDDLVLLYLSDKESVSLHGDVLMRVRSGSCEVYGAHLSAGHQQYLVTVPKTGTYPVLCAVNTHENDKTVSGSTLEFQKYKHSVSEAANLYPMTRNAFAVIDADYAISSIPVVFGPPHVNTHSWPIAWDIVRKDQHICNAIVAVGSKGVGKSTFLRFLLNEKLTDPARDQDTYYLDLDPGQPDFGTPGTIAAYCFDEHVPVLTYPAFTPAIMPLRRHWLGDTSPKDDPAHYIACVRDLIVTTSKHISARYPDETQQPHVFVNTPGWIKGTGLELLLGVLQIITTRTGWRTRVVHLGTNASELIPLVPPELNVLSLEAHPRMGDATAITAADTRAMNLSLYFQQRGSQYSTEDVTMQSWRRSFLDLSFMVLRSDLAADEIIPAINGTIIALLAYDDECLDQHQSSTSKDGIRVLHTDAQPLDPASSHCLGMAIVHGFDLRQKTISLLTPIKLDELDLAAESQSLVLCTGAIEVPQQIMMANLQGNAEGRPYLTDKPGQGAGWQSWHVRRNVGRRVRNG